MKEEKIFSISVVIPVYNGVKHIRSCLDSILKQECSFTYEVIVVDSSHDKTPDIIRDEYPMVRLIHLEKKISAGSARNIGINNTQSNIVFFFDSDCVVPKDYMMRALKIFRKNKDISGIGGSYATEASEDMFAVMGYLLKYFRWLPRTKLIENAKYLLGGACAYRREAFKDAFFNETFIIGDDACFSAAAAKRGFNLLFDPSLTVIHKNQKGFKKFLKTMYLCGEGTFYVILQGYMQARLLTKYPALILLSPFYIVPKMFITHICRRDFRSLYRFILFLPLVILGKFTWAYGFLKAGIEYKKGIKV